ncbi:MAG: universal stress protein [Alphaproteobacteria bacterium]|nr:universal stress protein [Alphaproteobacteria bacterium]
MNAFENELLPEPYRKREIAAQQSEAKAMLATAAKRSGAKTAVHVPVGAAANAVIETARAIRAGLVIMAPAGHATLSTVVLGSTVERVLRHADQPVLVVKQRCQGAYRSIAIAVDLSDSSALALRQALRLFPQAQFTVVHAFETPFSAFAAASGVEAEVRALHDKEVAALVARESAKAARGTKRAKIRIVVAKGRADEVLARELAPGQTDLVVLGTHGLTGVRRAVIGSTAERLIETLPCDVLAVRPPG